MEKGRLKKIKFKYIKDSKNHAESSVAIFPGI